MIEIKADRGKVTVSTTGPGYIIASEAVSAAQTLVDVYSDVSGDNIAGFVQQILRTRELFLKATNGGAKPVSQEEEERNEKLEELKKLKEDITNSLNRIHEENKNMSDNPLSQVISSAIRTSIEKTAFAAIDNEIEKLEGENE